MLDCKTLFLISIVGNWTPKGIEEKRRFDQGSHPKSEEEKEGQRSESVGNEEEKDWQKERIENIELHFLQWFSLSAECPILFPSKLFECLLTLLFDSSIKVRPGLQTLVYRWSKHQFSRTINNFIQRATIFQNFGSCTKY